MRPPSSSGQYHLECIGFRGPGEDVVGLDHLFELEMMADGLLGVDLLRFEQP